MAWNPGRNVKLRLEGRLPFVVARIRFERRALDIDQILVDTGSGGSVFSADAVEVLGIEPQETDIVRQIRGVGGSEFVYSKSVETLSVGDMTVKNFEIQVGAMYYGFPINGIIGMDFLMATQAVVNLATLDLYSGDLARR